MALTLPYKIYLKIGFYGIGKSENTKKIEKIKIQNFFENGTFYYFKEKVKY